MPDHQSAVGEGRFGYRCVESRFGSMERDALRAAIRDCSGSQGQVDSCPAGSGNSVLRAHELTQWIAGDGASKQRSGENQKGRRGQLAITALKNFPTN